QGPVFKGFGMVLPERVVDCHGVEHAVSGYTADAAWRRQNDTVRETLRREFDHVTLLCDSVNYPRTLASGFDGIAIYDPFVGPSLYPEIAGLATRSGLLFSLNVNAGFDGIEPRDIEPGSCYSPPEFLPPTFGLSWSRAEHRETAAQRSADRIRESFAAALAVQTSPALANDRRGFFLLYVNSFNEWHEGTAFEPMRDAAALGDVERAFGYHNPARGDYRLSVLGELLRPLVQAPAAAA
ncbi:MAG TPA: hypothetical protein VFO85_04840, partial [Vicinamibacteria bacterium]|nr:hypothetical protein [Vicinamibacteria bacterium]